MNKIILASGSPRRKELLAQMGVKFAAQPSEFNEYLDETRDPSLVAKELACYKALEVAKANPDDYVIGSDEIISINGQQLEKPIDIDDARKMLRTFAGNSCEAHTSIAIINLSKQIELVRVDAALVYFKPDSEEIALLREEYLATGDWKDKVGGFGIQSGAAVLIEKIEGDYDTIVGLPTRLLADMLTRLGIEAKSVRQQAPVPQVDRVGSRARLHD